MPRIIPLELNIKLRREYRVRFFSLLFFNISIAAFATLGLMTSSYFLLSLYEKTYANEGGDKKNEEVSKLNTLFNTKVDQVHSLSKKIPTKDNYANMHIADLLFEYTNSNVQLSSIEILPQTNVSHVTVRGSALTRDSLIEFQNNINKDNSFKDFTIPIESLTKQKNISFDVNFIYHEN